MPNVGSWNGKWSGRDNLYAITRSMPDTKQNHERAGKILAGISYYYNFGDGWGASVRVSHITSVEARKVRAKSKGFCGYEWMVDSIMADGVIYGPTRPKPVAPAPELVTAAPSAPSAGAGE